MIGVEWNLGSAGKGKSTAGETTCPPDLRNTTSFQNIVGQLQNWNKKRKNCKRRPSEPIKLYKNKVCAKENELILQKELVAPHFPLFARLALPPINNFWLSLKQIHHRLGATDWLTWSLLQIRLEKLSPQILCKFVARFKSNLFLQSPPTPQSLPPVKTILECHNNLAHVGLLRTFVPCSSIAVE